MNKPNGVLESFVSTGEAVGKGLAVIGPAVAVFSGAVGAVVGLGMVVGGLFVDKLISRDVRTRLGLKK